MKARPVRAALVRGLPSIRSALAERQRQAEIELAAERERARTELERVEAARRELSLFASEVGAILPLRKLANAPLQRPRPAPAARQRERDDQAVLLEAISDAFDVETLLDTDDALSFRRRGIGMDVVRKLRRGVWALQGELDLHGLRSDAARERLVEFLRESARRGRRCVRIVHGKGLGSPGREPVLKGKVKAWLVQHGAVLAFTYARPADGGHGAVIVLLRAAPLSPPASSRSP
ncbi:MAG: Smr/MutS family endonuclease [Pseudomonadota bacterium]|nr:Smr/MutS family endonuclease [Pseudomonadota bacterium]